MAMQLGALRDAPIEAGASSTTADKAAEEVATYDARLAGIETRLPVLTWMADSVLGVTLLVPGNVIALWAKRSASAND